MRQAESASGDWRQVYADLRGAIDRGVYAPGGQLPTIAALAKEARITRHGARRVLERLRDEAASARYG